MVTFTAHLSVIFKRLTRCKQVVLAAMLEGKSMLFNMAANTNHTTLSGAPDFVEKSKCHKISALNVFSLKFGCKIIIFMCSVNFRHQQDSNSLLKEALVT